MRDFFLQISFEWVYSLIMQNEFLLKLFFNKFLLLFVHRLPETDAAFARNYQRVGYASRLFKQSSNQHLKEASTGVSRDALFIVILNICTGEKWKEAITKMKLYRLSLHQLY